MHWKPTLRAGVQVRVATAMHSEDRRHAEGGVGAANGAPVGGALAGLRVDPSDRVTSVAVAVAITVCLAGIRDRRAVVACVAHVVAVRVWLPRDCAGEPWVGGCQGVEDQQRAGWIEVLFDASRQRSQVDDARARQGAQCLAYGELCALILLHDRERARDAIEDEPILASVRNRLESRSEPKPAERLAIRQGDERRQQVVVHVASAHDDCQARPRRGKRRGREPAPDEHDEAHPDDARAQARAFSPGRTAHGLLLVLSVSSFRS
jgi:hypothetical protein